MMKNILKKIVVHLLELEAKAVLKKYKPKIVAITGTVGKTSTKDAVYTAMCNFYFCRKSQKSFNSEFGVPLTILGVSKIDSVNLSLSSLVFWIQILLKGIDLILLPAYYPEWLILEIGADKRGDIENITKWIKPDIVIITKLSKVPVHVEFFNSPEEVFKEKGKLVEALKPGGTLILNADDEDVISYRNKSDERVVLFGNEVEADIKGSNYNLLYDAEGLPSGISFNVEGDGEIHRIELLETLGSHHSYHILAALAVVSSLKEDIGIAAKSFRKHEPTPGRMRLIPGIKKTMIIDDTYNSSPIAAEEALKTLKSLKAKRKMAVLGDMLELGKYSNEAHKKAGELVQNSADVLVTVGLRSRATADAALDFGMDEKNVFQFDNSNDAGDFIQNIINKGDLILVKGSQGVRMEKVVEEIMAEPEKKENLLVRQSGFWKHR
jgi:UDP-N-acetylmuramoyl-tripeptide--D-alanyl-D-alanine ligase